MNFKLNNSTASFASNYNESKEAQYSGGLKIEMFFISLLLVLFENYFINDFYAL